MKKNILNIINKKVAGRSEGIEKVESFLFKTEKYNQELKLIEARQRAERVAENERLAAEREAQKAAEIEHYCAKCTFNEEIEPETPVFRKIKKQTEKKPSSFQITPLKAQPDYLEKQLKQLKIEHFKARNSDLTSGLTSFGGRGSDLTTANTTFNNDEENDMPFAVCNTV